MEYTYDAEGLVNSHFGDTWCDTRDDCHLESYTGDLKQALKARNKRVRELRGLGWEVENNVLKDDENYFPPKTIAYELWAFTKEVKKNGS